MARNRVEKRNVRKLTKISGGSSYALTLPIEYIREFGWQEHQKLVVKKSGKKLIIEDWEG